MSKRTRGAGRTQRAAPRIVNTGDARAAAPIRVGVKTYRVAVRLFGGILVLCDGWAVNTGLDTLPAHSEKISTMREADYAVGGFRTGRRILIAADGRTVYRTGAVASMTTGAAHD